MTLSRAFWDLESNGLLVPKVERGQTTPPMDRIHCIAFLLQEPDGSLRKISAADQDGYEKRCPSLQASEAFQPNVVRGWERMPIVDALQLLSTADIRIGHNSQDFDERAVPLIYPWWKPKPGSQVLDTLILSRAIYPDLMRSGPNTFKLPKNARNRHNLASWGIRLGEHKGDYKGGWAEWSEEMQIYMEQDVIVLFKLFKWLMAQKPSAQMSALEHAFAAIIRRQETRGFAFDMDHALELTGKLRDRSTQLEADLIAAFGEWWAFGKAASTQAGRAAQEAYKDQEDDEELENDPEEQAKRRAEWLQRREWGEDVAIPTKSRGVKLPDFPDIEVTRLSPTTGKTLQPYVGSPKLEYGQGHAYTPIKRVQFNPGSRTHVRQRLIVKYGWEPTVFTKGGKNNPPQPKVDDDVLRGLPYDEAQILADYYLVLKRLGQIADGKKAWLKVVRETELPNGKKLYRVHGRMNTNGAITGRGTHMDPNMGQVVKNSSGTDRPWEEVHGWQMRACFIAAEPYELVGADGSSLELCMLGHYVFPFDGGEYAKIVSEGRKEDGTDPHSWMRDEIIGVDIIGAGDKGRDNSKTAIYAELFGAGKEKLGGIAYPTGTLKEKIELGGIIKERLAERFLAKAKLQEAIESVVADRGYLIGLDGRTLRVRKAHAALNTLLQSAGAVVMKKSLVLLDASLQAEGLRCGVDYEFVANVHDEYQAEVLPEHFAVYRALALQAVPLAGKVLQVKCPLKAEVSPTEEHRPGRSWKDTH